MAEHGYLVFCGGGKWLRYEESACDLTHTTPYITKKGWKGRGNNSRDRARDLIHAKHVQLFESALFFVRHAYRARAKRGSRQNFRDRHGIGIDAWLQ